MAEKATRDFVPREVAKEVFVRYADMRVQSATFDDFWKKVTEDGKTQSDGRKGRSFGALTREEFETGVRACVYGLNAVAHMNEADKARRSGDLLWERAMRSIDKRLGNENPDAAMWVELAEAMLHEDTADGADLDSLRGQSVINGGEPSEAVMQALIRAFGVSNGDEEE